MQVVKASGEIQDFDVSKLISSIRNALELVGAADPEYWAGIIANTAIEKLRGKDKVYTWEIRDAVGLAFKDHLPDEPSLEDAASAYELYWIYKQVYGDQLNEAILGLVAMEARRWSYNAVKVLEARYLRRDPETWRFIETPDMMLDRVALHIASVTKDYEGDARFQEDYENFYRIMANGEFLPNSPTLMNAGTRLGILSACFVIPVRDSMTTPDGEGIMDALRAQAITHQHAGGTGFSFSELRPEGDIVSSSGGVSSGPLSFMRLFDLTTDVVKQGGKRRGANMGIMHIWHADIEKFIVAKTGELKDVHLQNFNISVGFNDDFMYRVANDMEWYLINPRKTDLSGRKDSRQYAIVRARHYMSEEWVQEVILDELERNGGSIALEDSVLVTMNEALAIAKNEGAIVKTVRARELFDKIVESAWDSGDPGFINFDEINRRHPVWYLGEISATNPCSESPLLPWEPCNLGSINLEKFIVNDPGGPIIDVERLERVIRIAVRFLDNVIDRNMHPIRQIREANLRTRKIGLGVMGLARLLARLGIRYDSPEGVALSWALADFISRVAYDESIRLAGIRGVFPAFDPERYRPIWETMPYSSLGAFAVQVMQEFGLDFEVRFDNEVFRRNFMTLMRSGPTWVDIVSRYRKNGIKNATVLSIAPTGTISILAGASPSIEPFFALAFIRKVAIGEFIEYDQLFLRELASLDGDTKRYVLETGHLPEDHPLNPVYRTAHEMGFEWHILHQAVWQNFIDMGVSKTINMRSDEPVESVWRAYWMAWRLHLKGITVYRDKSKSTQVINTGVKKPSNGKEPKPAPEPSGNGKRRGLRLGRGKVKTIVEGFASDPSDCPTCDV